MCVILNFNQQFYNTLSGLKFINKIFILRVKIGDLDIDLRTQVDFLWISKCLSASINSTRKLVNLLFW